MGKAPFSKPNPKFSKKRQFQVIAPLSFDILPKVASGDVSSINRRPTSSDLNTGGYVTFSIGSYSKKEMVELKNQLVSELERIRRLKHRIDSSESLEIRPTTSFNKKQNKKGVSGNKRPFPNNGGGFLAAKDVKKSNQNNNNNANNLVDNAQLMKRCGQILAKLMKHKLGFIFNTPVDVKGLNLHDYYDIIKCPMDLGTVKKKLRNNEYDLPVDFAADVRLTFNNAMKYNPKGHDVHTFAEQFLSRFEDFFRPIRDALGGDLCLDDQDQLSDDREVEHERIHEVQASSWDHHDLNRSDENVKKDKENVMLTVGKSDYSIPQSLLSDPQSTSQLPLKTPSATRAPPPMKPLKEPKPKAKDPNKRAMTLEEKHKLGIGLQSLPQEKMEQVVQIIRKRNRDLRQDGDEIELDIEAVDTETLWELDRLVTNYKKMVSKIKRQALMGIPPAGTDVSKANKDVSGNERIGVAIEGRKPKKGDGGDEDVDIGDEVPTSSYLPLELEKKNAHASSSTSSSSSSSSDGSSSSDDSDSGSSSGSDSEDAHS